MNFDTLQFYPTPASLGKKLCSFFTTTPTRLLEPHAGAGDLVRSARERFPRLTPNDIDLYEIDPTRHSQLTGCGNLIGLDFLESLDLSIYSHVVMNPPFRQGVQHVLHAWNKLFSGEIAAILNASGIRDPETKDERRLRQLIDQYGHVEYFTEAFRSPDTLRQTDVEVALVYLRKQKTREFWEGSILEAMGVDSLVKDDADFPDKHLLPEGNGLAISEGQIPALVRAFQAAWEAKKESIVASHRASLYVGFFHREMNKILNKESNAVSGEVSEHIHKSLNAAYAELRQSAWMSVLNTAEFRKYLTRKAQNAVLADFEKISLMEFSAPNIYGFLQGFALRQGDINAQMVCDLFDQIVHANSENCLFYRWKSNAKHQIGMALQRKRFILSGFSMEGWRSSLDYHAMRHLEEVDRITALVTGQRELEDPISGLFASRLAELRDGARLGNRYFDVRYYPGIGTVHFFPKDQKLIDRINMIVGKHRRWMPENFVMDAEEAAIDKAYKSAVETSKAVQKKLDRWVFWQAIRDLECGSDHSGGKLQSVFDEEVRRGGEANFWESVARLEGKNAEQGEIPAFAVA